MLFLIILLVKNPSKARLGGSLAPRGIGWVHSVLSAGGQAVLEGPGRCFPTLGSLRLLHAICRCPHDISSFSRSVNFFKQLDDGLSEGMLKPPGFLRPKPRTARASLLLHSCWPRQVTSLVQIQSLDGAVGVFRDEVLPGGHLWGLHTTDRVQAFPVIQAVQATAPHSPDSIHAHSPVSSTMTSCPLQYLLSEYVVLCLDNFSL